MLRDGSDLKYHLKHTGHARGHNGSFGKIGSKMSPQPHFCFHRPLNGKKIAISRAGASKYPLNQPPGLIWPFNAGSGETSGLVRRTANGDAAAFRGLLDRHGRRCFVTRAL